MPDSPIRTIDELVQTRAITHANIPILSYPNDGHNYVDHTASELNSMTQRVAQRYVKILPKLRKTSDDPRLIVAVLGTTSIEYIITYLALQRLGLTCLFLSTRLVVPAYLYLLEETGC
jgi:acyl-CoA synthetase (AMP-forming)/AMP-acid ligase II